MKVDLDNNSLTGTIPSELGNLPLLTQLFIGKNNYDDQSLPESLSRLDKLSK